MHALLRREHELVDVALRAGELAVDRKRARDVRRVALVFAAGVDQQQLAVAELPVVARGSAARRRWGRRRRSTDRRRPARRRAGIRAPARLRPGTRTSPAACAPSPGGARRTKWRRRGASASSSCASLTRRIASSAWRTSTISSGALTPVRARPRTSFSSAAIRAVPRREQAERRVQRRLVGREIGQHRVELGDRMRRVEAEDFARGVGTVAKAVPDLALRVLLAAEQDLPVAVGAGDEHDHRFGLRKPRQVVRIAVVAIRIVANRGCAAPRARSGRARGRRRFARASGAGASRAGRDRAGGCGSSRYPRVRMGL